MFFSRRTYGSGEADDLAGVNQPSSESDDEGEVTAVSLSTLKHTVNGDRNGCGGSVSHIRDVMAHGH